MAKLDDDLERLAAMPRAELMARKDAWEELRALIGQAIFKLREPGTKQSSPKMSTLASEVMARTANEGFLQHPTSEKDRLWLIKSARSLAGSVLSQDQIKGQEGADKPRDNPRKALARNLEAALKKGQARPDASVPKLKENKGA